MHRKTHLKKKFNQIKSFIFCFVLMSNYSFGQTLDSVIENPDIVEINKLPARASFFPYTSVEAAKKNVLEEANNHLTLNGIWKFHWSKKSRTKPQRFLQKKL